MAHHPSRSAVDHGRGSQRSRVRIPARTTLDLYPFFVFDYTLWCRNTVDKFKALHAAVKRSAGPHIIGELMMARQELTDEEIAIFDEGLEKVAKFIAGLNWSRTDKGMKVEDIGMLDIADAFAKKAEEPAPDVAEAEEAPEEDAVVEEATEEATKEST